MSLRGQHILSVKDFTPDIIELIFRTADKMQPYARRERRTHVLDGAILGNMFFEPSTRTRVSFGCAFNLLGGKVRETTGMSSSALAKGESLYDTAQVLSGYSDVIAMRHPQAGSVAEFAAASRVPVLNGGDGANEHPTQALLDLYTIYRELKRVGRPLQGARIVMVGDLKYGRTVHSLSQLLSLYNNVEFVFVSPDALRMPQKVLDTLAQRGHRFRETDSLTDGLTGADVVYQTRIQEERFESQQEADQYRGTFRINQHVYHQFCQPATVIMHPLPRDSRAAANELDNDLNDNPNLAIFRQTDNGVLVRMALFALVLGVDHLVDKYAQDVPWYVPTR